LRDPGTEVAAGWRILADSGSILVGGFGHGWAWRGYVGDYRLNLAARENTLLERSATPLKQVAVARSFHSQANRQAGT
jgi:hypothetical protein